MKQDETIFKVKKRYVAIMILCFLYGGFSILLFAYNTYTIFWTEEIATAGAFERLPNDVNRFEATRGVEGLPNDANGLAPTRQIGRPSGDTNRFTRPVGEGFARFARNPTAMLSSPETVNYLLGGILTLLAGIAIWQLIREKEIKTAKQEIAKKLLLPDEKAVIEALKKSDNELTQAKLVKETGLSKVQVHRAVKRLESKGALEKHDYGLTNKIILKKEFFE